MRVKYKHVAIFVKLFPAKLFFSPLTHSLLLLFVKYSHNFLNSFCLCNLLISPHTLGILHSQYSLHHTFTFLTNLFHFHETFFKFPQEFLFNFCFPFHLYKMEKYETDTKGESVFV